MLRKRWLTLGAWALLAGGVAQADDKGAPPARLPSGTAPPAAGLPALAPTLLQEPPAPDAPATPGAPDGSSMPQTREQQFETEQGTPPAEGGYGPTPLPDVKILQNQIFGK